MFLTKTRLIKLRALWFTAAILLSTWYLYWICYDVFVWNKTPNQVPLYNHTGLTLSVALVLLGTQIGKIHLAKKPDARSKKRPHARQIQQAPEETRTQPTEQAQQTQPAKEEEEQVLKDSSIPPGCSFYLGYLHQRPKSAEIPEKCLSCINVVDCISRTARPIMSVSKSL